MRKRIVVDVSAEDRARLAAIVANRNSPQKHVWRARIVLLTADGEGTAAIMRQTGRSKSVVWRWQERFRLDQDGRRPAPDQAARPAQGRLGLHLRRPQTRTIASRQESPTGLAR